MTVEITFGLVFAVLRTAVALFFAASAVLCHRGGDNKMAIGWWIAAGAWLP